MRGLWPSNRSSTHLEPTSPLTVSHDETLKSELAAGILQSLDIDDVRDEVARKNRWWNRWHQRVAEKRANVTPEPSDDDMGKVVRIDSDDHIHYHGSVLGKALPWVAAAVLGAGGAGATYLATRTDKPPIIAPSKPDRDTTIIVEGS